MVRSGRIEVRTRNTDDAKEELANATASPHRVGKLSKAIPPDRNTSRMVILLT
jgi:hypothetical protein